jgi:hypothetical protein
MLQQITYVIPNPQLEQIDRDLKRFQVIIGQIVAGDIQVKAAQDNCERGPQLNLTGRALFSASTIMHAVGIMPPPIYNAEREELISLFPECSSTDAYQALASVPILGHRYAA